MAEEPETEEVEPKKSGKMGLILGVVLALAGAGGGYYAVSSGLIGGSAEVAEETKEEEIKSDLPPIAFVSLDPMLISLPTATGAKVLRFSAQLEVPAKYEGDVSVLKPRFIDMLNGYLRAVTIEEMADPTSLARLRAQMLRRVQTVAGEGRVNDLLIMEFIVN